MTPPEKVTPKQLSNMLIEKHRKFLGGYKREFDVISKLNVLNEKQEQLKYWMDSASNDEENPNYKKYLNEKKITDTEIINLKNELKEFQPDGIVNKNSRSPWLEQHISMHKDAIEYWNNKYKDFSVVRRKPDERKGTEGKNKRPKARDRQKG